MKPHITMSRRKQVQVLKTLIPFSFFSILIFYLSRHQLVKNPEKTTNNIKITDNAVKPDPQISSSAANANDFETLRKSVLSENIDEFLEIVLQTVTYSEVDLYQHRLLNLNEEYDREIENFHSKVIPGLGEGGSSAAVPLKRQWEAEQIIKKDAFNRLLSEMISLNRSLPDTRELSCHSLTYDTKVLPSMSIIIIFTNEAFVSIIRMIYSLVNRTPANLLKEIILVDDFSDHPDLKWKLERYLAIKFSDIYYKIRLLRLSKRSGLIKARMIGAHIAIGDVMVFLDAHCEVINYWSEPLLQRIKQKRDAVVVPVIDVIDAKTMEYFKGTEGYFYLGGFKWSGHFYWISIPEYEASRKKHHYEPTRTPTMAGGLFAIDRRYFWEMGSYDPEMLIWGGENLEMSFRIWQCGGSVETIPCSRIGHIFRPFRPYSFEAMDDRRNVLRVATVWMDDYKKFVIEGGISPKTIGDVSRRVALRQRLKCKSFQWYLDNIYKEKFKMHHDSMMWGQVKNIESNTCLDDMGHPEDKESRQLEVYPCHPKLFASQTYYLSNKNELRKEIICAGNVGTSKHHVYMRSCDEAKNNAFKWDFDRFGKIINRDTKKCLTVNEKPGLPEVFEVVQETCGKSNNQKWSFNNYNKS